MFFSDQRLMSGGCFFGFRVTTPVVVENEKDGIW
jgi:hypothetical protein